MTAGRILGEAFESIPLLGLTGTIASGKDTVASYLSENHGYYHVSTSEIVRAEALKRFGNTDQTQFACYG